LAIWKAIANGVHYCQLLDKVVVENLGSQVGNSFVDACAEGSLKNQQHAGEEASNILGDKLHQAA
jgi:hypothetical protein